MTETSTTETASAEVTATAATDTTSATQTTESATTEVQQTQTATETTAVEYTDFTAPEGITFDPDILGDFKTVAKEHGLNQDQAQKFADLGVKLNQKWAEAQMSAVAKQADAWAEASKADKEFGGEKFAENLAVIKKAREAFVSDELMAVFEKSGLGNHPDVLRMLYRAGKQLSTDGYVAGTRAPSAGADRDFYNKSNMN
jgi:hypothetical protein